MFGQFHDFLVITSNFIFTDFKFEVVQYRCQEGSRTKGTCLLTCQYETDCKPESFYNYIKLILHSIAHQCSVHW